MTPHDDAPEEERTASGHVERRQQRCITVEEFDVWRRRARNRVTVLFLLVAAVSSLAAWLGYEAGKDSERGLATAGREATTRTCLSGADLRVTVAKGFDDLRRLAVGIRPGKGPANPREEAFLTITQPAIDRLLTQAAGRPYTTETPAGEVTPKVEQQVLDLARGRCDRRTAESFDTVPGG